MTEVLNITSLTKKYPRVTALNNVSLTINQGEVFGILGPNGSGKTTLLSIITGVIFPDFGTWKWFKQPVNHGVLKKVGSLIEVPNFYPYLSLTDNLKIVAEIRNVHISEIDRVLGLTRLQDRYKARFYELSLGLKQRLAIASALLGDPAVLIFDEPTNGLDPEGIAEVREILIKEASRGKTIIMASHILDEVEKICSHVAILKTGSLLASGRVDELLADDDIVIVESADIKKLNQILKDASIVKNITPGEKEIILTLNQGTDAGMLNKFLFDKGVILTRLETRKKTLESQFLEMVKR